MLRAPFVCGFLVDYGPVHIQSHGQKQSDIAMDKSDDPADCRFRKWCMNKGLARTAHLWLRRLCPADHLAVDGSRVRADAIEVRGTLQGNPPDGSLVLFVRSQDGTLNWLHFPPIETSPIMRIWKGSATVLARDNPLTYSTAIAFLESPAAPCLRGIKRWAAKPTTGPVSSSWQMRSRCAMKSPSRAP